MAESGGVKIILKNTHPLRPGATSGSSLVEVKGRYRDIAA